MLKKLLLASVMALASASAFAQVNQVPQVGTSIDFFDQGWDIPKAATVVQQLCLNLNGASISSGVLAISLEWTED